MALSAWCCMWATKVQRDARVVQTHEHPQRRCAALRLANCILRNTSIKGLCLSTCRSMGCIQTCYTCNKPLLEVHGGKGIGNLLQCRVA